MIDLMAIQRKISGLPNVSLSEPVPGFPVLHARHNTTEISLSLYGGQLLSCRMGNREVLWRNPAVAFVAGNAIRAGVPVCWPWFGPAAQPALPAHGIVRTVYWAL